MANEISAEAMGDRVAYAVVGCVRSLYDVHHWLQKTTVGSNSECIVLWREEVEQAVALISTALSNIEGLM